MSTVTHFIDPNILNEAQEATSFLLKVPEHAKRTAKAAFWTELFDITEASIEDVPAQNGKPARTAVKVRFKVAAESADATNVGKQLPQTYLLNYPALDEAKGSKERLMMLMSTDKLRRILVAVGLLQPGDGFSPYDFFSPTADGIVAVVGAKVYGVVKHHTDATGTERQEIQQFDDLTAGATNA
jgi:hypothetical protein